MRSAVYPERTCTERSRSSRRGYTLIELLIVISIIGILAVVGFVNFKAFSAEQVAVKAAGQVQTLLRLAQSNATTSTFCGNLRGVSWSLIFRADRINIDLACGPTNIIQKTYTLENATVDTIIGTDCGGSSILTTSAAATLTYAWSNGVLTFSTTNTNISITPACLASASWTFTIKNTTDTTKTKTLILSKGGTINVQ